MVRELQLRLRRLFLFFQRHLWHGRYYSGGFLWNPKTKQILLHLRSPHALINPGLWAFFGGLDEPEDKKDPIATWIREMQEELAVTLDRSQVKKLGDYYNKERRAHRHIFCAKSTSPKESFVLGEGADFDWFSFDEALRLPLTDFTRQDLLRWAPALLSES